MKENLYCYTPDEMAAFVEGIASPESKAAFEKHILECADCRLEWVEVSLARDLPAMLPPQHIQDSLKNAPARRVPLKRRMVSTEKNYTASRVAALLAASVLIAVVIILASTTTHDSTPAPEGHSAVATPRPEAPAPGEKPTERIAQPPEEKKEKKVKGLPLPEPQQETKIVKLPEPLPEEKTAESKPVEKEKKPEVEIAPGPRPEPAPEKLAGKQEPSKLEAEKKELPKPAPDVPSEKDKLAVKLASADAEIFKKLYRDALFSIIAQEQKLLEEARKQAPKFDPILGRPIQPGAPVAPAAPKPEAPKEEPKQEPATNPNAPPPLPRVGKLRDEGKIPEKEPSSEPEPSSTPPPLPRIDKLRKDGKIPSEQPKDEPKPEEPAEQPKTQPKKGAPQPLTPKQPAVPAAGPAKRGIVQIPEITPEQLKKIAKAAGFEPVKIPGLKAGIILAHADTAQDSDKDQVVHLFYYFGKAGFSVFERETGRKDRKNSYHVLYNGKGKTRTLMWASGKREFVLVSQKLSKRQLLAIEASVRELFE